MYPQTVQMWLRGQALTAARLNQSVAAINYLLSKNADEQLPEAGTDITVAPPGGDKPPTPNFQNPPADDITALGQPFKFFDSDTKILPPPVSSPADASAPSLSAKAYFTTVTTDKFGNPLSVTVADSAAQMQTIWDGTNGGTLSTCTGLLGTNDYGENFSIDANPVFLPIVPISPAMSADSVALVRPRVGNSIPIARLRAGAGTTLSLSTGENNAAEITIASDGLSSVEYDSTISAPAISAGKLKLNFAADSAPGAVRGVSITLPATTPTISAGIIDLPGAQYDQADASRNSPGLLASAAISHYDPSDPSVTSADKQPKITDGHLLIPLPETDSTTPTVEASSPSIGNTASPGTDGWVQTFHAFVWTGNTNTLIEHRQLMRFSVISGVPTLQVVNQQNGSSGWQPV